jgi:hypothetical protein
MNAYRVSRLGRHGQSRERAMRARGGQASRTCTRHALTPPGQGTGPRLTVRVITGNIEIANRPGFGVVVPDVGRYVFDANGNLLFFAGGLRASQFFNGEQIFCTALA